MSKLDAVINNIHLGGVNRSSELDYMKGILIILVVWGHVHTPLTNWIYQFHIPVFFMISGFCWKTKHSNNVESMKHYVIGKIKRLYVPFIIMNVLFILLNNIFLHIGLITDDPTFLDLTSSYLLVQKTSEQMDYLTMIIGVINALFFSGGYAKMCGVTWFLSSLFMVCVVHMFLEFFISRLLNRRTTILIMTLALCLIACLLIKNLGIGMPGIMKRFFGCYAAYLCGVLFKEFNMLKFCNPKLGVIAFIITVILVLIPLDTSVELSKSKIGNPVLFLMLCFSGFVFCYELARLFAYYNLKPVEICGKESMSIFLLHPISFKIVTFLYLLIYSRPMILLAAYPALDGENSILPVFYVIVGVFVPLVCDKYYSIIKEKAKVIF